MIAKDEFLDHVADRKVKAAIIFSDGISSWNFEDEKGGHTPTALLKVGYSEEEYKTFLEKLNFDYDDGYGGQELFGTIWYEDGSWSERGEYDGSEWWAHKRCPEITNNLKK